MSQHRVGAICTLLFCIVFLVASCGRDRNGATDIDEKVIITLTAIALETSQSTSAQSTSTAEASTPAPPPVAERATSSSSSFSSSEPAQSSINEPLNLLSSAELARIVDPELPTEPPLPLYYINDGGQISRLESDGNRETQITDEPLAVDQYDVAPSGERIVYVSNNRLIELELATGERTILVDNATINPSTSTLEDRITQAITAPQYSGDSKHIVFGLNGVKQVQSGAGLANIDQLKSLLDNDPYPDFSNSRSSLAAGPIRFYQPLSWSPNGRYLLLAFSYYPEGGGLVLLDVTSSTLIELWSSEPDTALCCEATWRADSQSILIASSQVAYGAPGLTLVHVPTGEATLLIRGFPIEPLSEENPFRFVRGPFIFNQNTNFAFLSKQTTIGGTEPYVMQLVDGSTIQSNALRPEGFLINGDVLWAEDGRGAIVVDVQESVKNIGLDSGQDLPVGSMFWIPIKGDAIFDLPVQGRSPQWADAATTDLANAGIREDSDNMPQPLADLPGSAFQIARSTAGQGSFDIAQLKEIFLATLTQEALETELFDVELIELSLTADVSKEPLWAAYTYGSNRFDVGQPHVLAIYRAVNGTWEEIARQELADDLDTPNLEPSPEYLDINDVQQVRIEPTNIWFEVSGGTGAHSGTYNLLRFDGEQLYTEVASFSSSPSAGSLADLDGDGQPEVLLNATDYYVFCYDCGVQAIDFTLLHWNGANMEPITLAELPSAEPEALRAINSRALAFAQAGLWKDALATVQQLSADEVAQGEALGRNVLLIELIAESRRAAAEDDETGYSLLDHIFYGDYEKALDLMRDYEPAELFTTQSALIVGTVAEGWEGVLADWVLESADPALAAVPQLAPAHFLKGWAEALVDREDPIVLEEIRLASTLAPDDSLVSDTLSYLEALTTTVDIAESILIELEEPEPEEEDATPEIILRATPRPTATETSIPTETESDVSIQSPESVEEDSQLRQEQLTEESERLQLQSDTPTPEPLEQQVTQNAPETATAIATATATATATPLPSSTPTPLATSGLSIQATDTEEIVALDFLNIRLAPNINSVILDQFAPGLTLKVVGRVGQEDTLWWQVIYPPNSDGLAWVYGDIQFSVPANENSANIPSPLPPTPLPLPTNTLTPLPTMTPFPTMTPIPTATFTPIPTNTFIPWTSTPTSTPTFTPTFTPSPTWTFTITPTPTPLPTSTPFPTPTPFPTSTPFPTPTPFSTSTPFPTPTAVQAASGRLLYSAQGAGGYDILVHQIGANASSNFVVGNGVQPDLNPQNNIRIAYYSISNDNKGLRGYDIGSGIRIEFDRFVEDSLPSWNPQGNKITFASNREGDRRWRVYVIWADGQSEAQPIANGLDPDWWPFGDFIVYKGCNQEGGQCGLWTTSADGSDQQPLTNVTSDSRPTWAPDGNQIVFMSEGRHGNWDLYVVDASDGNNVRRLTTSPAHDGLPAVSPDGQYVAFYTNRSGTWGIWYIPLNGQGIAQPLIPDIGPLPDWLIQGVDWVP